jgi:uncharacterized protein YjiS (DUF1127 family)
MNGNLSGSVADIWRMAVDYLQNRRKARQTMREIGALNRFEATRVLADVGLVAADLRNTVSRPFAFEDLLTKGMRSVGIDPRELVAEDGNWFRNLQQNCSACRSRSHCRTVVSHSQFAERFHEFCPNSGDFDQILSAKARGLSPSGNVRQPGSGRPACFN